MAIIAARSPYNIIQTLTDLEVKIKSWATVEPTEWQKTIIKSSYETGVAQELKVEVAQYIRPHFTIVPPTTPTTVEGVVSGEFLNVKISINDVEETHRAVYGYNSPVDESWYDHWQCTKMIHYDTDSFLPLPPGIYNVTWTTNDGQVVNETTTSATLPNRAVVAHPSIDLSTAKTLAISTDLYTYNYNVVCPFMDGTIMFMNAAGQWDTFDVNGRQDFANLRETKEYIPYDVGELRTVDTQGSSTIVVNTGWVDYDFYRVLDEFMESNQILWLYGNSSEWLILENNTIRRQVRRTDKMLNYTFNFKVAKPTIPII